MTEGGTVKIDRNRDTSLDEVSDAMADYCQEGASLYTALRMALAETQYQLVKLDPKR